VLPAAHRIRTAADFRETTRRGAKASRPSVVIYLLDSGDGRPARVGVIASSSIGGSVVRHRATRRIRGAVSPLLAQWPCGVRIVVRALPGADSDPLLAQQVLDGVESLLTKVARRRGLSAEATVAAS
jgi:ribonuclease P protein component